MLNLGDIPCPSLATRRHHAPCTQAGLHMTISCCVAVYSRCCYRHQLPEVATAFAQPDAGHPLHATWQQA